MASKLEDVIKAYNELSKIPLIANAKLNSKGNKVSSTWSVRNLDKGKNTKYIYTYTLDNNFKVIDESDFGTDISNELLSSVSPTNAYRAVIREEKEGKDSKKQYLEIWQANRLKNSINLSSLDIHGEVYADSEFGSLSWMPDESAVVYIAEKKKPKLEAYYKRSQPTEGNGSGETPPKKGEEYVYRADWGEQLVGKQKSVIVVCYLQTEKCVILEGLPDSWCPGQVRFSPDGAGVIGVAWETEPRRLGLIFCTNRPSYIFTLSFDGVLRRLSAEGMAVRSPRYCPRAARLVWLQRPADGPHHACHSLVSYCLQKRETSTLIDIVMKEKTIANSKPFYGIFSQKLPDYCFTNDDRIVFSTPQQTEVKSYVLEQKDNGTSVLVELNKPNLPGSLSILDVKGDVVLASLSNITTPGQLYVGRLPATVSDQEIEWHRVSEPIDVPPSISGVTVQCMQFQHATSQDSVTSFSAIYTTPAVYEGTKMPLIVWPHGGPHSGFVNAYSLETALFAMLGFASVQINYRGSSGAGQASIEFLPKRVGVADVVDCKHAADEAIRRFPIDPRAVCLFGGSHGGFLVTHLSGQYPDFFRAVVTRNPVTDVAAMFSLSDIPDWCAVEAGYPFTEKGPVSEEQLLAMRRCSPIAHVHKVKAPTALMLGSADKRVPYYQGLEYYHRLKANGVEARIYLYEDNHSLSSLPVEMDNLINSAYWFIQHLQKD